MTRSASKSQPDGTSQQMRRKRSRQSSSSSSQQTAAREEELVEVSEEEYELEDVVSSKLGSDGKPLYLIKWKGYSSEENTWEPEANIVNVGPAIQKRINAMKGELERGDEVPVVSSPPPSLPSSGQPQRSNSEEAVLMGCPPSIEARVSVSERLRRSSLPATMPESTPADAAAATTTTDSDVHANTTIVPPEDQSRSPKRRRRASAKASTNMKKFDAASTKEGYAVVNMHKAFGEQSKAMVIAQPLDLKGEALGDKTIHTLDEARYKMPQALLSYMIQRLRFPEAKSM